MNRGIKPLIERHLVDYLEESINGFVEYEDIDVQVIVENVCVEADVEDTMLVEDLFYDVVDDVIREYNENMMIDKQIEATDRREARMSKSI